MPVLVEPKPARQANMPPDSEKPGRGASPPEPPGVIIDDAVAGMLAAKQAEPPEPPAQIETPQPKQEKPKTEPPRRPRFDFPFPAPLQAPAPEARAADTRIVVEHRAVQERALPEPIPAQPARPRSPREVVFALDTAFIFFTIVLALVGSSYFIGYKRGQEERPTGLVGIGDVDVADPAHIGIRNLAPPPRTTVRPSEQDYTLVLRTEPVTDDPTERLQLELAEAMARGKQAGGGDVQGFIFRTGGNDPRYVLAVSLGRTINDPDLEKLRKIYNDLTGITLSREQKPYVGCRIAPVKELGTLVY